MIYTHPLKEIQSSCSSSLDLQPRASPPRPTRHVSPSTPPLASPSDDESETPKPKSVRFAPMYLFRSVRPLDKAHHSAQYHSTQIILLITSIASPRSISTLFRTSCSRGSGSNHCPPLAQNLNQLRTLTILGCSRAIAASIRPRLRLLFRRKLEVHAQTLKVRVPPASAASRQTRRRRWQQTCC